MSKRGGFSLIELVLVLLILAVLVALALPSYQRSVIGAHRSMARLTLMEIAARQERHLQTHKRYGASLGELGIGDRRLIDAMAGPAEERDAIYQISLVLEEGEYRGVTALPRNGQQRDLDCGVLTLRLSGQRQASGRLRATPERCW